MTSTNSKIVSEKISPSKVTNIIEKVSESDFELTETNNMSQSEFLVKHFELTEKDNEKNLPKNKQFSKVKFIANDEATVKKIIANDEATVKKTFKCLVKRCKKEYKLKKCLENHIKKHNVKKSREKDKKEKEPERPPSSTKRFSCRKCDKKFKQTFF